MPEPKLSSRGIVFIQNPWRAKTELGMNLGPGETFPPDREFTMPWPGHVERKKKKKSRKKKRSGK